MIKFKRYQDSTNDLVGTKSISGPGLERLCELKSVDINLSPTPSLALTVTKLRSGITCQYIDIRSGSKFQDITSNDLKMDQNIEILTLTWLKI